MKVYIGENIRRLRTERGMTQEELAGDLCVSFQTVSKWERSAAYPDVEMIPVIANYFGVTIDELMGNTRIQSETKIEDYLRRYDELTRMIFTLGYSGLEDEYRTAAEAAFRDYPDDPRVMNMYCSYQMHLFAKGEEFDRAVTKITAKKLVENCRDVNIRFQAMDVLLTLASDDLEEAEAVLKYYPRDLTSIRSEARERYYRISKNKNALNTKLLSNFTLYFDAAIVKLDKLCSAAEDHETRIKLTRKKIELIKTVFEDEDYLWMLPKLAKAYETLAVLYLDSGDYQHGLEAFLESVEYLCRYYDLPCGEEIPYTSVIPASVGAKFVKHTLNMADPLNPKSPARYLAKIQSEYVYDCVREDDSFNQAVARLEKYI